MYLLIGIWGSRGEIRPQGVSAGVSAAHGGGTTGVTRDEATLYLLSGRVILVGISPLVYPPPWRADSSSFSFLEMGEKLTQFDPKLQSCGSSSLLGGCGILAASGRSTRGRRAGQRLRADRGLHADTRGAVKLGTTAWCACGMGHPRLTGRCSGRGWWAQSPGHIVTAPFSAMAQTESQVRDRYSSVSTWRGDAGDGHPHRGGAQRLESYSVAHGVLTGSSRPGRPGLEKSHSRRISRGAGSVGMSRGIRQRLHLQPAWSSLGLRTAGFGRDAHVPGRLAA